MATDAHTRAAPTRAPSIPGIAPSRDGGNVLPFKRPANPLAFDPSVPAFDRHNPAHVAAWNSMYAYGLACREADKREGR